MVGQALFVVTAAREWKECVAVAVAEVRTVTAAAVAQVEACWLLLLIRLCEVCLAGGVQRMERQQEETLWTPYSATAPIPSCV